jgi:hypothetical protein
MFGLLASVFFVCASIILAPEFGTESPKLKADFESALTKQMMGERMGGWSTMFVFRTHLESTYFLKLDKNDCDTQNSTGTMFVRADSVRGNGARQ